MQQANYHLDTRRKKFLYSLGLFIAFLYAIFCGISLAGYVVLTFGTGAGALIGALVGAFVCTAANFKTSITKIPEILVDFFGRKKFFDGFFKLEDESEYEKHYWRLKPFYKRFWHGCKRRHKQIGLGIGVFLSSLAGLAIFGQGYGGITAALMAFAGITAATSAITGIGIFGAVVFFVAFWAIALKAIILELQKKGWFSQFRQFFKDLFDIGGTCRLHPHDEQQPAKSLTQRFVGAAKTFAHFCLHPSWKDFKAGWRNATHTCDGLHKSKLRTYVEGGVLTLLLAAATPLAILGVVTAMMASHLGIVKFVSDNFANVSEAGMNTIKGFSWVFVVGLASLGQLPFYLKTTLTTLKRLGQWGMYKVSRLFHFGRRQAAFEEHQQLSFADKAMYLVRLVNAGYSALYSYVGGGADHSLLADAGAVGGVLNSFSAPEKIGGSGFSDIWKNFNYDNVPDRGGYRDLDAGWVDDDVAVAPGGHAATMLTPLLMGYAPATGGYGDLPDDDEATLPSLLLGRKKAGYGIKMPTRSLK